MIKSERFVKILLILVALSSIVLGGCFSSPIIMWVMKKTILTAHPENWGVG